MCFLRIRSTRATLTIFTRRLRNTRGLSGRAAVQVLCTHRILCRFPNNNIRDGFNFGETRSSRVRTALETKRFIFIIFTTSVSTRKKNRETQITKTEQPSVKSLIHKTARVQNDENVLCNKHHRVKIFNDEIFINNYRVT